MVNKPKSIGTAAETAVVRAARTRGFPHAERVVLHGSIDHGDVRLTPGLTAGVILEVKGGQAAKTASDNQITAWLAETERERANAHADIALLVTARAGIGAGNAHRWACHATLTTLLHLIDGYDVDRGPRGQTPIRMTLDSALALLREAGYGNELDDAPDVRAVVHAREGATS